MKSKATHSHVKKLVKKGVKQHESKQHPGQPKTALKLGHAASKRR